MTKTNRIQILQDSLSKFALDRDWGEYHTPKNLAMALSVECSELLEIFQWMSPEQSLSPDTKTRSHIREEIGDIMIYLCMVGSVFKIDPVEAAFSKLENNESKYPAPHEKS